MPHGHGPAGEAPEEIRAFADGILKGAAPPARVTGQGREGRKVWATFRSRTRVVRAELLYTCDLGAWPERRWETRPATLAGNRASATLPEGVTVYYLNLYDDRDRIVSTEHEELGR
jgi:hypothetical protein